MNCNWCMKNTESDMWDRIQNFKIKHTFIVYTPEHYSKYDGKILELNLCNKCSNELIEYIEEKSKISSIRDNEQL